MNVSVPLTLRRVAASFEPQAWFLLGPDVRIWLQTISEWDVDHARLRLAVLPDSGNLGQPAGVVVTSELEGDLRRVAASAICQGYHCVRGRIWIPVDAELSPRISQPEADELFPVGYRYLWHPTLGMHPVATGDLLTLVDLLSWSRFPAAPWDAAEPGMAIVRHIRAIQVLMPENLEQWLEEGGGDIGGDPESLGKIPPLPGEPGNDPVSNAIRGAGQQLTAGIGSFARKLSQNLGQGQGASQVGRSSADGGDGWLRRLADWSSEQSANFQRKLDAARNQQLNRLMAMLDQDPDRGLRFAISLGDNAYRGVDNSSPWLGESSVNFDWGRLFGGGGQAAIWDLSINHRARLSQKYRDLAQRERNLGRFRRAAYIYAHLLGDMVAAASALKAGGHYREAAALYQHKLNRKRMAAACLAEGDFLEEAIALYLETSGFSEAGDLARRMEDKRRAADYYEQAVAAARQKNDLLTAANIRRLKLDDLDGAVDLLQAAWPYSADADKCLHTEMQWLTQAGQVHRAVERIERVRDMQVLGTKPTIQACQVFSKLSCSSPRQEIVSAAREACTRIAARKLSASSIEDRTVLLAMADMHQQDRLLRRDCHRYVDRRSETTEATKPAPNRKRRQNACTLTHRMQLMPVAQWLQAVRVRDGIAAVGDDGHGLSITMSDFQGTDVACAYRMRGAVSEPGVLFTALPHGNEVFCRPLFRDGGDVIETGVDSRLSLSDGWHIHADAITCCLDGDRLWTARYLLETGEVLIEAIGEQGPRRGWQFVWDNGQPMATFPMHLHARSNTVFATALQQLVMLHSAQVEKLELPGNATGICGSLPNTLSRVVVTFEEGAQLVYCNESFSNHRIADGVQTPAAEFTASGHLVVAGTRRLEIYQTIHQELQLLHAEEDTIGDHPIAVLRGHSPTEFIVVDASGITRFFKIHAD